MMHLWGFCETIMGLTAFVLLFMVLPRFFFTGLNWLYEEGHIAIMFAVIIAVPGSFYFIGGWAIIIWLIASFIVGLLRVYARGYIKTMAVSAVLVPALITYEVYTAIYQLDSFYKNEFEKEIGIPFPAKAIIVEKDASYPNFQGEYEAIAKMELTPKEYKQLKLIFSAKLFLDTINVDIKKRHRFAEREGNREIVSVYVKSSDKVSACLTFLGDNKTVIFDRQ